MVEKGVEDRAAVANASGSEVECFRVRKDRRPRAALLLAAWLSFLPGCGDTAAPPTAQSFLIQAATIVDGTGSPGYIGSLRVADGVITEVAADDGGNALSPTEREPIHDATGLILAPGFIDTHSHHDGGLLEEPTALAAVSQGITTIVAGQDGGSRFPIADFFAALDITPAAVNVASYAGHGTLRRQVMGDDFRRAAAEAEVAEMQTLLDGELASGALGLSTGLEYDPGIYSTTDEVVALATTAAAHGGRYISHMRSEDRALLPAIEETIEIARRARLPVQISHFKLAARGLWGWAAEILARLDQARAEGLDISADVYPYEYWQSTMTVLFPERDFTDPEAARYALEELVAPDGMIIARFGADTTLEGKTLAQIATERGTDPVTTYIDLIAESRAARADGRDGGESIVATSMDFDDIARLLSWPHTNVSSDGGLRGAHPRGFGAYPRVLGRYVREEGRLGLERGDPQDDRARRSSHGTCRSRRARSRCGCRHGPLRPRHGPRPVHHHPTPPHRHRDRTGVGGGHRRLRERRGDGGVAGGGAAASVAPISGASSGRACDAAGNASSRPRDATSATWQQLPPESQLPDQWQLRQMRVNGPCHTLWNPQVLLRFAPDLHEPFDRAPGRRHNRHLGNPRRRGQVPQHPLRQLRETTDSTHPLERHPVVVEERDRRHEVVGRCQGGGASVRVDQRPVREVRVTSIPTRPASVIMACSCSGSPEKAAEGNLTIQDPPMPYAGIVSLPATAMVADSLSWTPGAGSSAWRGSKAKTILTWPSLVRVPTDSPRRRTASRTS